MLVYQIADFQSDTKVLNQKLDVAKSQEQQARQELSAAEQAVWDAGRKQGLSDEQIRAAIAKAKGN